MYQNYVVKDHEFINKYFNQFDYDLKGYLNYEEMLLLGNSLDLTWHEIDLLMSILSPGGNAMVKQVDWN